MISMQESLDKNFSLLNFTLSFIGKDSERNSHFPSKIFDILIIIFFKIKNPSQMGCFAKNVWIGVSFINWTDILIGSLRSNRRWTFSGPNSDLVWTWARFKLKNLWTLLDFFGPKTLRQKGLDLFGPFWTWTSSGPVFTQPSKIDFQKKINRVWYCPDFVRLSGFPDFPKFSERYFFRPKTLPYFQKEKQKKIEKITIHHIIVEPFLKIKNQHSFFFFSMLISSRDSEIFNFKINIQNMKQSLRSQFIIYWSNWQARPQKS